MKTTIKNIRIAFPNIFEPQAEFNGGDPKYNAAFIVEDKETADKIEQAMAKVAQEKWPRDYEQKLKKLRSGGKICLKDGDEKADYAGFEGNWFIRATNRVRPSVFDKDGSKLTQKDGRPYAGSYVDASIDVWAQDNQYGQRINAALRGVKFSKDGQPFAGGGAASENEFEFEESDEDAVDDLV